MTSPAVEGRTNEAKLFNRGSECSVLTSGGFKEITHSIKSENLYASGQGRVPKSLAGDVLCKLAIRSSVEICSLPHVGAC